MTGICAGLSGQCNMGDVLVADPAWDWQMGKFAGKVFRVAPDQIDITTAVAQRCVVLASDKHLWFDIWDSFAGEKPTNVPTIRVGPVASGAAVVADQRVIRSIKDQHRNSLGVEMEL